MSGEERSGIIKYIHMAAAALACVVIFVIFGTRSKNASQPSGAEPSPLPTASQTPGGVTLEAMTEALEDGLSGLVAFAAPERRSAGEFVSELGMADPKDSAAVLLFTDAIGRVERVELRVGYLYADTGTVGGDALETILAEYARREAVDKALIEALIRSVTEPWSRELDIGAADLQKLIGAVLGAYDDQNTYAKKFGNARFSAATERTDTRAEFILDIDFDPAKMK